MGGAGAERLAVYLAVSSSLVALAAEPPAVRRIRLKDTRYEMPVVGLGTGGEFERARPFPCREQVEKALRMGYRHIDTSLAYGNLRDVADGIAASGVDRSEIWITTNLPRTFHGPFNATSGPPSYQSARDSVTQALKELGMTYIDLLLVQFPNHQVPAGHPDAKPYGGNPKRLMEGKVDASLLVRGETWKAMEDEVDAGRVLAIGVANFLVPHLEEMKLYARKMPVVNQLELHPYLPQKDVRAWCEERGIAVQAYGSVRQNYRSDLLKERPMQAAAQRTGGTEAQVALAWALQKGVAVLPNSRNEAHMLENLRSVELELSADEVRDIDKLLCTENRGCRWPPLCGLKCRPGTYYWEDPNLVEAFPMESKDEL